MDKKFSDESLINFGKRLSFLLRHDTSYQFDEHGYRDVDELVEKQGFTKELLDVIVETNDKKRYEFSEDKKKIRARQGHSVNVNVDLTEAVPPDELYHGTAIRFIDSIEENGINSGTRQYVHLSKDRETAINVGKRHGRPCVIIIDTKQMKNDGIKFYLSNNGVWMTKFVDKRYIKEVIIVPANVG